MKIGIIGTGMIAKAFIDGARKNDLEIHAVCSRTMEKAKAFAKECQIEKTYDDYHQMIADPKLDFIYVATPNGLHFKYCKLALEADKHVMCEKPFCSNAGELKELIRIAKERKRFLFEAIINIHLPNFKILKEKINEIGRIRMVQTNFSQYSSKYNALLSGETPNVFNLEYAGGALLDLNIYNIHLAVSLFGEPIEVDYIANLHPNGVDVSGVLILKYEDFIFSSVGAKDCSGHRFVSIQGEQGCLYSPSSPSGLTHIDLVKKDTQTFNEQTERNGMYYELLDFKEIYEQKDLEACFKLLEESLKVMEIADKARKKANIVFPADLLC